MALRGFYLNPGFGTLEHALGSQNKKPKANAVHTGRGESPSWVKYALTNTPINSIPTKCPFTVQLSREKVRKEYFIKLS